MIPTRPKARANVDRADIGNEALVFDAVAERLHRLNPTGNAVLDLCDGDSTVAEIISELASRFDESTEIIAADTERLIDEFVIAGLVECQPVAANPSPLVTDSATATDLPRPPAGTGHQLGPFRAIDHRFFVECVGSEALVDEVGYLLESFAAQHQPAAETVQYTIWQNEEGWWIVAGDLTMKSPTAAGIVDHLTWLINQGSVRDSSRFLILHAAALGHRGSAVVLTGASNSGKSTLAAALVTDGFEYLTDEAAAIDLDTGEVVAFPKAITLESGSQQFFANLVPIRPLANPQRWHLSASEFAERVAMPDRLPLRHLVFPEYRSDSETLLEPLETIDATSAIVTNSFNLRLHPGRLADLVAIVESCSRHRLIHAGLSGPTDAIRSLW